MALSKITSNSTSFLTSNSSLQIPVGTTAQRPTGSSGQIRFNTTLGQVEFYSPDASAWLAISQKAIYTISYLIAAGGGGGGAGYGNGNGTGGGGAGGLLIGKIGRAHV